MRSRRLCLVTLALSVVTMHVASGQEPVRPALAQVREEISILQKTKDTGNSDYTQTWLALRKNVKRLDPGDVDEKMIDDFEAFVLGDSASLQLTGAESLGYLGAKARRTVPALQMLLPKVDCEYVGLVGGTVRDSLKKLGFPAAPRRCPPMEGLRWHLPSIVPEVIAEARPVPPMEVQDESPLAKDDALAAECWTLVKRFPFGGQNWSFREPVYSHSGRWGDVMRADFVFAYVAPPPTGRLVCWRQDGAATAVADYDNPPKWEKFNKSLIVGPTKDGPGVWGPSPWKSF
jgi:hypothetical protein